MAAKFELKKAKNGQFFFNLKSGNGQIILTSETYKSKDGAENGIKSVKKNAASNKNFDILKSAKNQPYFVLKSPNKEPIGKSEIYSSTTSMKNGIKSVMTNAPKARIEDLT